MTNTKQCSYWWLTINENASCFSKLQDILNEIINDNPNVEYSYIKHNADDDDKNIHYHLSIYFKGKVKRFSTILNIFEGAHIEMTNKQRYKRCIQYLIHKNNPEKEQYNSSLVISNIDRPTLDDILNGNGYDFELFEEQKLFDYFNEFYRENKRIEMSMFILRFGLDAINKYYFIIKDQLKEYLSMMKRIELRLMKSDKLTKAFNIQYNDIFIEWYHYKHEFGGEMTFEEYKQEVFNHFKASVDKGFIDIDEILSQNI